MANQSTYSERHVAALAGMIASQHSFNTASGNAEASAGVAFGVPVVVGTGDRNVKKPAANGDNKFLGVSVRRNSARLITEGAEDKYNQKDEVEYLTEGEIWVTVGENVADGDPVYVTEATGAWGKTSGSNIFLVTNAIWMTTASSGALAKLRIR